MAKVVVKCSNCNKEFETTEYKVKIGKGKFCSKKCFYDSRKGEIKQCLVCGKEMYVERNLLPTKKYCSWECQYKSLELKRKSKWSIKFDCCQSCGTKDIPHFGLGLCSRCYKRKYRQTDTCKKSEKIYKQRLDVKNKNRKYALKRYYEYKKELGIKTNGKKVWQNEFFIHLSQTLNCFIQEEAKWEWLRNPETNYLMRVDFYVPFIGENGIAIEFHGPQHIKECPWMHEKLEKTRKRDLSKARLLLEYSIPLLAIIHDDPWDDKKWLRKQINKCIKDGGITCTNKEIYAELEVQK
ncbi:hypothetical protein GWJ21_03985 [Bacillus coagulans]|uniref:hypothetical protein n=1 Tax=Heyndrickxia coagulans TaxID=1398 RepID=UPI001376779C|nr:hypothetical protein [Heyndrickxia coagulans]NCG67125.1 hypothetical protein [Heyndrickxia coagulans]